MKTTLSATALTCALLAAGFSATHAEASDRRVVRANADGGVTATTAVNR